MSLAQVHPITPAQNSNAKISIDHELKNRFKSDQYKIEQPYVQITVEGYQINSLDNSESYTAARPRHIFRMLFARALGFAALIAVFIGLILFSSKFAPSGMENSEAVAGLMVISVFAAFGLGLAAYFIVATFCAPIRRATIKDASGAVMMLIAPTSRYLLFNSEFAISDSQGRVLASLKKNFWSSIFQKRWHAHDDRGKYLFTAIEDNLFLSVMRRYLNLARFIPMHFSFTKGGGKPFGEFRRGYSVRDKYKLNYNPAAADGWLMVAAGILLDTGENR